MPLVPLATRIVRRLVEKGFLAYFAGGWVRDYLLGLPSDDIDIATSATPEEVQALFPKTVPVGLSFGIVLVIEEGHPFEVAMLRQDCDYIDGRRPQSIRRATPEEDAKRRDFTINGLFYDPLTEEVHDFVGGKADLDAGILRAIGNPHERIKEDKLRMMRAIRYANRFRFPIEPKTLEAIKAHASEIRPSVAIERIWQEFIKMGSFGHLGAAIVQLHEVGLLGAIFPELKGASHETISHLMEPTHHFPQDAPPISIILELFPAASKTDVEKLSSYLKLSSLETELALYLKRVHDVLLMPPQWQEELAKIEWAKLYAHAHSSVAFEIFAARLPPEERAAFLKKHRDRRAELGSAIGRLVEGKPLIKAQDLMERGIKPGKKMGLLLKEAEKIAAVVEDKELTLLKLETLPLWRQEDASH